MNWNDSLYWYWRERGGEFFASMVWKDSGLLFLDLSLIHNSEPTRREVIA